MSKPLSSVDQRAVLRELLAREERLAKAGAASLPTEAEREACERLKGTLFKEQSAFFFPPEGASKRRVACCTRRAGKTTGDAAKMLITATLAPRSTILYIGLTAATARETVWPVIKEMCADYDLPFDCLETTLTLRHRRSTGQILLKGADNVKEIEKRRGLKTALAILDESGSMGAQLEDLVVSVIGPGLRDLGGELLLNGTPGYHPSGLFYKAQAGMLKNWEVHRWSMQDNPYLPAEAKDLKVICDEEGLTLDDPKFIREYTGQYALNANTQVFAFDPKKNLFGAWDEEFQALKPKLTWYLGVDFGWTDHTAIVALGWHPNMRRMWAAKSWSAGQQTSDDVAAKLKEFIEEFRPKRIIGDTGGSGKQMAGQIMRDYRIYIEQAEKRQKLNHIEFINSAFLRGDLLIERGTELAAELPQVLWNEKKTDMHARAQDNQSMALVYAWRQAANQIKGELGEKTRAERFLEEGGEPEKAQIMREEDGEYVQEAWFLDY